MIKKVLGIISFIFFVSFLYSEEGILIGISSPYLRNESSETVFFEKNFNFELLFNYSDNYYSFEIFNTDINAEESRYLRNLKREAIKIECDYILHSVIYSSKTYLFYKVQLISPYTDTVFFNKLYSKKIDFALSEFLTECSLDIINKLNSLSLTKVKKNTFKRDYEKEKSEEEKLEEFVAKYKHEIFFSNTFFKNHASTMSFLELFTGYGFSPFNFFSVEAGMFLGGGSLDKTLAMLDTGINRFYVGWFAGFNFYARFVVEPSIGMRFELNYLQGDAFYFTIPVDVGLKIYINPKNAVRINTSFQFTALNLQRVVDEIQPWWENNYIIGFMIGYAKKL